MKRLSIVFTFTILVSCNTTKFIYCPPDKRPVEILKKDKNQYAIKGIDASVKAILSEIAKADLSVTVKQEITLLIKPLENKYLILRNIVDNSYHLAKREICNIQARKDYEELVIKLIREMETVAEASEKIKKQINSSNFSGTQIETIKNIVNDYEKTDTAFPNI